MRQPLNYNPEELIGFSIMSASEPEICLDNEFFSVEFAEEYKELGLIREDYSRYN